MNFFCKIAEFCYTKKKKVGLRSMENKDSKKYLTLLRHSFPIWTKTEKEIYRSLAESISTYVIDNPSATYEELQNHFGSPLEVVSSYMDTQSPEQLIKMVRTRNYIKIVVSTIIICILIFFFIRLIYLENIYRSFQEAVPTVTDTQIIYFEEDES